MSSSEVYYIRSLGSGSTYTLLDSNADVKPDPALQFKIVIVGDSGCGKTSLFTSFIRGFFPTDYEPTIFENHRAFVKKQNSGEVLTVDLWDTAGQEDYERLRRLSYQDADLVILAYSLAARESLMNIPEVWAPEIINFCPGVSIMLVGLKADIPDHKVDPVDAVKVANNIGAVAHIQCSAKEMFNVAPLFDVCFNVVYNEKRRKANRLSAASLSPTKKRFSQHHRKESSLTMSLNSITNKMKGRSDDYTPPLAEDAAEYNTSAHSARVHSRKASAHQTAAAGGYEIAKPDFGYNNDYTGREKQSSCCAIM